MSITPIARLTPAKLTPGSETSAPKTESAIDNFGQILGTALNGLSQKEAVANQAVASMAAGEDIEIHQVMLAMQEADIAFQLAMQVRNKLVEGYEEIMRTQV